MAITGTIMAMTTIMATTSTMATAMGMITIRIMVMRMLTSTITTIRIITPMAMAVVAGTTITGMTITGMTTSTIITTGMVTATNMADQAEFQRLHWFSPAFPVGGYAYSHGIEKAVETGDISIGLDLTGWIDGVLRFGAGRNDAILLGEAWRRAGKATNGGDGAAPALPGLLALAELGMALGLSQERRLETAQQGAAFLALAVSSWPHPHWPEWPDGVEIPYPVAVGLAGAIHAQPLEPLLAAYLQAFATNLIAAGIRLAVIGQNEAQRRLASLQPVISDLVEETRNAGLDDLGGMAIRGDLMSLRHETQTTRLFRS